MGSGGSTGETILTSTGPNTAMQIPGFQGADGKIRIVADNNGVTRAGDHPVESRICFLAFDMNPPAIVVQSSPQAT